MQTSPTNAAGLTFKAQESGYLVGYLAALMAKAKGGKQVLGAVGGKKIPSVDSWIAGYRAGAKKVNPKIKVLIGVLGSTSRRPSAPKCKEIALAQIAQGAQSVFQVAGGCGLGALDAAKQKKVWGIGVDADQAYLGPHILTSGVKRVDTAVFAAFKASQAGTIQGGRDLVFNLKNKGQDVGKISPKVPKAFIAAMNAQKKLIISGKVVPPADALAARRADSDPKGGPWPALGVLGHVSIASTVESRADARGDRFSRCGASRSASRASSPTTT